MLDRFLADLVLCLHAALALFLVSGVVLVPAGGLFGWRWVRRPFYRVAHVLLMGGVAWLAWAGAPCPLTVLENHLRASAGQAGYPDGFIAHWVGAWLFVDLPVGALAVAYTAAAILSAGSWWWIPPRWRGGAARRVKSRG